MKICHKNQYFEIIHCRNLDKGRKWKSSVSMKTGISGNMHQNRASCIMVLARRDDYASKTQTKRILQSIFTKLIDPEQQTREGVSGINHG